MSSLHFDALIALAGSEGPADYFASWALDRSSLLVAADGGADGLLTRGYFPHILAGDFDSFQVERLEDLTAKTEIFRFRPDKDYSDGELAVALAVSRTLRIPVNPQDDEALYGILAQKPDLTGLTLMFLNYAGIRQDHSLANVALARSLSLGGADVFLTDGTTLARITAAPAQIFPLFPQDCFRGVKGKYENLDFHVSILALDDQVRGLTVRGLKWGMEDMKLPRGRSLGLSNRARGSYPDQIELTITQGTVMSFVFPVGL